MRTLVWHRITLREYKTDGMNDIPEICVLNENECIPHIFDGFEVFVENEAWFFLRRSWYYVCG